MKLLADENIESYIVAWLRDNGHDVLWVAEELSATSDEELLKLADSSSRVLLTNDLDFGELVFRQAFATYGVFLIRLAGLSQALKAEMISSAIRERASEIPNSFSVVTPGTIRIRHKV